MVSTRLPTGLYALIDDGIAPGRPLEEKARGALEGGAKVLQLRMKHTPAREAVSVVRAVSAACHAVGALCIVNDRVDLVLLGGADGVHLGDEDVPVQDARRLLGPDKLIGATTRSLEQIRLAQAQGADHAGLGPIFQTSTKTVPHALLGVDGLARIAAESPLPIVAIAGITLQNMEEVAAAGAHCAAVAGDLLGASDVAERARQLVAAFARGQLRRTIRST